MHDTIGLMSYRHGKITALFVALTLILGASLFPACSSVSFGAPDKVSVGDMHTDSSLFIYVAQEQNFFRQNGIDLTLTTYDTPSEQIDAMNSGEIDIATFGEYPVAGLALARSEIGVIASIDRFQSFYLVGRKDLGVESAPDLAGKRVGLVLGALPQFYFGRFLDIRNIGSTSVDIVNVNPADWVAAISTGMVDAIVVNQSYLSVLQEQFAGQLTVWDIQGSQAAYAVLVTSNSWQRSHPDVAKRLLKSLVQAEDYYHNNQDKARQEWQKRFGYSDAYFASVLPRHQFSVILDQALILALEDESRWMIKNNLTQEKTVPDFNEYVYEAALKSVRPIAVNIIK